MLDDNRLMLDDNRLMLDDNRIMLDDNRLMLGDNRLMLDDNRLMLGDNRLMLDDNRLMLGDKSVFAQPFLSCLHRLMLEDNSEETTSRHGRDSTFNKNDPRFDAPRFCLKIFEAAGCTE